MDQFSSHSSSEDLVYYARAHPDRRNMSSTLNMLLAGTSSTHSAACAAAQDSTSFVPLNGTRLVLVTPFLHLANAASECRARPTLLAQRQLLLCITCSLLQFFVCEFPQQQHSMALEALAVVVHALQLALPTPLRCRSVPSKLEMCQGLAAFALRTKLHRFG